LHAGHEPIQARRTCLPGVNLVVVGPIGVVHRLCTPPPAWQPHTDNRKPAPPSQKWQAAQQCKPIITGAVRLHAVWAHTCQGAFGAAQIAAGPRVHASSSCRCPRHSTTPTASTPSSTASSRSAVAGETQTAVLRGDIYLPLPPIYGRQTCSAGAGLAGDAPPLPPQAASACGMCWHRSCPKRQTHTLSRPRP